MSKITVKITLMGHIFTFPWDHTHTVSLLWSTHTRVSLSHARLASPWRLLKAPCVWAMKACVLFTGVTYGNRSDTLKLQCVFTCDSLNDVTVKTIYVDLLTSIKSDDDLLHEHIDTQILRLSRGSTQKIRSKRAINHTLTLLCSLCENHKIRTFPYCGTNLPIMPRAWQTHRQPNVWTLMVSELDSVWE